MAKPEITQITKTNVKEACERFNRIAAPLWFVHCVADDFGLRLDLRFSSIGGSMLAIDTLRYYLSQAIGAEYEKVEDYQELSFNELTALFKVVEVEEFDRLSFIMYGALYPFNSVLYLIRHPIAVRMENGRPVEVTIAIHEYGWNTVEQLIRNALELLRALQEYLQYVLNENWRRGNDEGLKLLKQ